MELSLLVWNEIGAEGGDESADGNAKGWGGRLRKILVTRENNDLPEELTDDGADDDFLAWDPVPWRAGRLINDGVLHNTPGTGTSATICDT
jgi:hypothetical protein